MSREEQNSKTKKCTMTSNESMSKREIAQTKTSQSLNTESFEYFNQKTTSKKNITESPYNNSIQQSNSRYSSNNKSMQGNAQGLKCTCNQNIKKNILKCTCSQKVANKCTCGQFKKQLFDQKKSEQSNYSYQAKKQQKIESKINNNTVSQYEQKSKTYQSGGGAAGQVAESQTVVSKKAISYASPNKQSLQISQEMNENLNSAEKRKRIESNYCTCVCTCTCTCSKDLHNMADKNIYKYSYANSNSNEGIGNYRNESFIYSRKVNNINAMNINNANAYKSHSYDSRIRNRAYQMRYIEWNKKCVGQNNESLQILAMGRPELMAQCVQDMQVIQEPKPVQILLPIPQNEVDYPIGLEIYGKNSAEERRALKEAERLRKLMEICPEKNEELNIDKAYSTIEPHFENLNIDRKEQVFCERKNKFQEIMEQRKALSVEHSDCAFHNEINKAWEVISIENNEMSIRGQDRNFNKNNKIALTTKMNVKGIYKPDWNDLNRAIKTTKMNIDRVELPPVKKQKRIVKKPVKKIVKKPVKKPVKKIVKKPVKRIEKKEEEPIEYDTQYEDLEVANYKLELLESGRKFGPLKVENNEYGYKGEEKPPAVEIPEKTKYENEDVLLDENEKYSYEAEYPKNVDWNESTFPMSGRPFTIDKNPKPPLSTSKGEKISIKESYKPTDWNKSIKQKNEIKINMPPKKRKKQNILKERIKPVILKGKEVDWNKIVQKENDSKLQIDKNPPKPPNFAVSKENELLIENEAEDILINDDYNIVEENYSRPIRANIKKIEDYTEESASSEFDILKNIHQHESQFNQFRELVAESIKVHGQKVIINDISGKYPRKVEAFQGLDENFRKFANDQENQNQKFNQQIKINISKNVNRKIEQTEINLKQDSENGGYYSKKKIIQKQVNNEPIQKKLYYFKSKLGQDNNLQGKLEYELEQENQNENENGFELKGSSNKEESMRQGMRGEGGGYYKAMYRAYGREQQEQESEEVHQEQKGQREDAYSIYLKSLSKLANRGIKYNLDSQGIIHAEPQDKGESQQNKIKYIYKEKMMQEGNNAEIGGNHNHIEYVFEGEKSNSQMQQVQDLEVEQEVEAEQLQEVQQEEAQQEFDNNHYSQYNQYKYSTEQYQAQEQAQSQTQAQSHYIVREEIHQQPKGQYKVQYIYEAENHPGLGEIQSKAESHIAHQQQNYYTTQNQQEENMNIHMQHEEINQNQIDTNMQKQDLKELGLSQAQPQNIIIGYDKMGSQSQNQQNEIGKVAEQTENNMYKGEQKAYIKEITYINQKELPSEGNDEGLKYIALTKKEEQEEIDSQPQDEQPQDEEPKENIQKQNPEEEQKIEVTAGQKQINIESKDIEENAEENSVEGEKEENLMEENVDNVDNQEMEAQAEGELNAQNEENIHEEEQPKEEINNEEEQEQEQGLEEEQQGEEYDQEQEQEHVEYEEDNQEDVEGEEHIDEEEHKEDEEQIEGEEHIENIEGEEEIEVEENIEGNEQEEVEENNEGEEHIDEEHFEGEEQIEGEEEQIQENVEQNEYLPEGGIIYKQDENQMGEGNEIINAQEYNNYGHINEQDQEAQHLVSSVEEITGQNINFQNMNQGDMSMGINMGSSYGDESAQMHNYQENIHISPQITSVNDVQMGDLSANINQTNLVNNPAQIRAQIIQTRMNNANYINQVNIQRQQMLRQSPVGISQAQYISSAQAITQEPQYHNIVRNAQYTQNIQTSGSIKYEDNQARDPMMYSFGANSSVTASGNKSIINLDNNDFLISSLTNQNNLNLGSQQGGVYVEKAVKTTVREVTDDNYDAQRVLQLGQAQLTGNQKVASSPEQFSSSKKEPVDRQSKKKQIEEDAKKENINDFHLEPRDSRRKK